MSSDKDHQSSPLSSPSLCLPKGIGANKDFECLWGTCQGVSFECLEELAVHIDQEHLALFSTRKNVCCKWRSCKRVDPFADITLLSQHIRSHTGEKPFKCSVKNCDSKFAAKSNLIAHCKRRHGRIIEPLYLDPKELLKAGIRTTRETLMAESAALSAEKQNNASSLNGEKQGSGAADRKNSSEEPAVPVTRRGAHKRVNSNAKSQVSAQGNASTSLSNPILAVYGNMNVMALNIDSEIDEYSDFEELLEDKNLFSRAESGGKSPVSANVSGKLVKLGTKIVFLDGCLEQITKLQHEVVYLLGKYAYFEREIPPFSPITQNLVQYKREFDVLKGKVQVKIRKYRSMQENIKVKIFRKTLESFGQFN